MGSRLAFHSEMLRLKAIAARVVLLFDAARPGAGTNF